MIRIVRVNDLWASFRADPCLVDANYITSANKNIGEICGSIEDMRIRFAEADVTFTNNSGTAQLESACFLDDWTDEGRLHPGELYPAHMHWDSNQFDFGEVSTLTCA